MKHIHIFCIVFLVLPLDALACDAQNAALAAAQLVFYEAEAALNAIVLKMSCPNLLEKASEKRAHPPMTNFQTRLPLTQLPRYIILSQIRIRISKEYCIVLVGILRAIRPLKSILIEM